MANCIYCGQSVGPLRKAHKACEDKYQSGKDRIRTAVVNAIAVRSDFQSLQGEIDQITRPYFVDKSTTRALVISAWEEAAFAFSEAEEQPRDTAKYLEDMTEFFGLDADELNARGAFSKMVDWAILQAIMEGEFPLRDRLDPNTLRFNLQASEELAWVFSNVHLHERQTETRYVGGTSGVSVRVAKGVSFRTGSFSGRSVKSEHTVLVDTGLLGMTTKHIYFLGRVKSFRIPYEKIVSFVPYRDGIKIHQDAPAAKPQVFTLDGDAWLLCNLAIFMAQRRTEALGN